MTSSPSASKIVRPIHHFPHTVYELKLIVYYCHVEAIFDTKTEALKMCRIAEIEIEVLSNCEGDENDT
ncbi:unnamed protein product [Ceratitis capitata]|uniref:(Mediterranean fruit fly) hypothetical protein n=1 Tax=Ceratitis capitata TaxID=7213 RepID=A0A811V4J8_CERCA|nr:unnamed protein product [Ceratitis capitata]